MGGDFRNDLMLRKCDGLVLTFVCVSFLLFEVGFRCTGFEW